MLLLAPARYPMLLLAINATRALGEQVSAETEAFVVRLFHAEGRSLVVWGITYGILERLRGVRVA